ncbi:MAG: hypothetical protein KDB21_05100 [Acidimicrobiales bacterium]|nr:hypothetical protein [Acidimicrobiales bacterium]
MSTSHLLPRWAAPLAAEDRYDHFCALVAEIAAARFGDDVARLDPEVGVLHGPDGLVAWMGNLAATCAGLPPSQWRLCIYSFLSWADDLQPARVANMLRTWTQVRGLLRVRLLAAAESGPDVGFEVVRRPLGAGACLGLVASLDGNTAPISVEHADEWGVDLDEAWHVAERNLRRYEVFEQTVYGGHGQVMVHLSGGMFTTGHALRLDELGLGVGEQGALVAAPNARELFVLPLGHDSAAHAALAMSETALRVHLTEPNPVSPSLYWFRAPGVLVPAVDMSDGSARVLEPAVVLGAGNATGAPMREDAAHEHSGEPSHPPRGSTSADG